MANRKTALMWTIAWWFARRYVRRRAADAVTGVAAAAAARRGRLLSAFGALALVGLLVAAFVAWRKLFAQADAESALAEAATPPLVRADDVGAPTGVDAA
jgi:hypothetical protein